MPGLYSFGPVPSRRLGRSLGVNNVPSKTCTYACVYCQLGRTTKMTLERGEYIPTAEVLEDVLARVEELRGKGEDIDYLTIVPNGEPTLDVGLGRLIEGLKGTGLLVAVITNGSLLWREDVRNDLMGCDLVSMKVDAAEGSTWRAIDRPHPRLSMEEVLEGERMMAEEFDGTLITETMLVRSMNDGDDDIAAVSEHISSLDVEKAYISVPIRPPAVTTVSPPDPERVMACYMGFMQRGIDAELNITGEEGEFAFTGQFAADLLRTTSVHPLREDQMETLLSEKGEKARNALEELIEEGSMRKVEHEGRTFYIRSR